MTKLTYPIWIITQRSGGISPPIVPLECDRHIAVFSSVQKAADYMVAKDGKNWEFIMVSRSDFKPLVESFHQLGVKGICLDPIYGEPVTTIAFDNLK